MVLGGLLGCVWGCWVRLWFVESGEVVGCVLVSWVDRGWLTNCENDLNHSPLVVPHLVPSGPREGSKGSHGSLGQ